MTIHVCGRTEKWTPWILSTSAIGVQLDEWRQEKVKVYVPCCNRNAPIEETVTRVETAFDGWVVERVFKCAYGKGCHANPGYLKTAHLRYFT